MIIAGACAGLLACGRLCNRKHLWHLIGSSFSGRCTRPRGAMTLTIAHAHTHTHTLTNTQTIAAYLSQEPLFVFELASSQVLMDGHLEEKLNAFDSSAECLSDGASDTSLLCRFLISQRCLSPSVSRSLGVCVRVHVRVRVRVHVRANGHAHACRQLPAAIATTGVASARMWPTQLQPAPARKLMPLAERMFFSLCTPLANASI